MQIFLIALFAFVIVMSIMAVGVILGKKPITGSCGGVGAALGEADYECDLCGGDEAKCAEINSDSEQSGELPKSTKFYSADK